MSIPVDQIISFKSRTPQRTIGQEVLPPEPVERDDDGLPRGIVISEMARIKPRIALGLESPDPVVAAQSQRDLSELMDQLIRRIRRMEDFIRWKSLKGRLRVQFLTGDDDYVVTTLPTEHKPTVTVPWSDRKNSDPVADLRAMVHKFMEEGNFKEPYCYMNSQAWDNIVFNERVKDYFNYYGDDSPFFPTKEDIEALGVPKIHVMDQGYKPERPNHGHHSHLRNGEVIVTAGAAGTLYELAHDWHSDTIAFNHWTASLRGLQVRIKDIKNDKGKIVDSFVEAQNCVHPNVNPNNVIYLRVS